MIRSLTIALSAFFWVAPCARTEAPSTKNSEPTPGADEPAILPGAVVTAPDPLVDKVWMLAPGDGRPGVIRIFLSSGAQLQDSCFETFRLSPWRRVSEDKISWNEDGIDIAARIVALDDQTLTLALLLIGGEERVETYHAAQAPFVCPDMPR